METKLYIDRHVELVERCKQGERRAQYELYKQYSKAMFNVCMRILNHVAEAEDVLQEAFLDAFSNLHSFRNQSTFGAWLKQIVVNRAINHLRSRKSRAGLQWVDLDSQRLGEDDGLDVADTEPFDEEGVQLEVDRVRRVMQDLPEGYRVVLSLYLFEGYDHEEIGAVLGISETTSRTQYMRAKKRLLEMLK
ncbi:RNA polymerase sigma factor [Larkinella knui]|uniref:RNA polymerase sigma factor n=1 Tax=Larkinella knui TaxID=2025310 RepID=A0A3P1CCQ8_9BACT|nr:RNA polymerase sigma factor [Larkinella knui]RRB11018.1 RNA polymerase sigma factor [Larkinella knui]